jgi:predicted glutamine amidotransferase
MCIIVAKNANVALPYKKYLKNCYDNNNDGAGFAFFDTGGDEKLHVRKGYFSFNKLWADVRELGDKPLLVHFRIATHGSVSADNCHPFLLENGVAMAHNGILSTVKELKEDMTDSESFGRSILEHFSPKELASEKVKTLVEMAVGSSKIVMLTNTGKFIGFNDKLGYRCDDVWYSNQTYSWEKSSYAMDTYAYPVYTGYDTGEKYYTNSTYKNKAYDGYTDDPLVSTKYEDMYLGALGPSDIRNLRSLAAMSLLVDSEEWNQVEEEFGRVRMALSADASLVWEDYCYFKSQAKVAVLDDDEKDYLIAMVKLLFDEAQAADEARNLALDEKRVPTTVQENPVGGKIVDTTPPSEEKANYTAFYDIYKSIVQGFGKENTLQYLLSVWPYKTYKKLYEYFVTHEKQYKAEAQAVLKAAAKETQCA